MFPFHFLFDNWRPTLLTKYWHAARVAPAAAWANSWWNRNWRFWIFEILAHSDWTRIPRTMIGPVRLLKLWPHCGGIVWLRYWSRIWNDPKFIINKLTFFWETLNSEGSNDKNCTGYDFAWVSLKYTKKSKVTMSLLQSSSKSTTLNRASIC